MVFSPLELTKVDADHDGRQLWELKSPLRFSLRFNGEGITVTIPAGFITDFASVPRFLWPIFPPTGPWCEASVLHDYLYAHHFCSRFLADALFREAMYELKVPLWRRVGAYYAVRVFGKWGW